jgi:hypothetical protein
MLSWLMSPLTQEERELVAEVTHHGGTLSTETAHLILNAEVSHANLQRLQTRATLEDIDKYLNDEIINRYLNHCLTREDENISSNLSGPKGHNFSVHSLSNECLMRRIVILIYVGSTTI